MEDLVYSFTRFIFDVKKKKRRLKGAQRKNLEKDLP